MMAGEEREEKRKKECKTKRTEIKKMEGDNKNQKWKEIKLINRRMIIKYGEENMG
jgi:hypothetical protein